eukprot:GHVO01018123.1.p1 GENE.GHVO01018123.1~~GHVO01018123.1.p1  ORF type:complete len:148 (-),score=15.38 GHVO01018123.1:311-754(-)
MDLVREWADKVAAKMGNDTIKPHILASDPPEEFLVLETAGTPPTQPITLRSPHTHNSDRSSLIHENSPSSDVTPAPNYHPTWNSTSLPRVAPPGIHKTYIYIYIYIYISPPPRPGTTRPPHPHIPPRLRARPGAYDNSPVTLTHYRG